MKNKEKFLKMKVESVDPTGCTFKKNHFYYKLEESKNLSERIVITVGNVQFFVNKKGKLLSISSPTPIGLEVMKNPQLYTEDECREMVFNYAQFVINSMNGDVNSMPVGIWFDKNKKKYNNDKVKY